MIRPGNQTIDPDHLLGKALEFHQAGNLESAQTLYGRILEVSPNHFDALRLLGQVRQRQGRREEAHALISAACEIDPTVEMLSDLGDILQALGRNEEAVAAYDRALATRPRLAETLNKRGTALLALDRLAGAAMSFDRAIAIRPDYADAHCNRADLMCRLGRLDKAVAGYDLAIALRPDDFLFHYGRGRALMALGKFGTAFASFTRAVALRPGHVSLRFERGMALSALERHQEALGEYDKVLAKEPDHLAALNHRGIALQELGRFHEAEACYRRAIELCPDDTDAYNNRGILLQKLKRFEQALALHDHVLAIRPHDVGALRGRGNALQGLQRHIEALVTYDRALEIEPTNYRVLNNRGAAFNEIKMYPEAMACLDKAIALAPDLAEAHYHRGNALKGMKRLPEALASYEKALAIGASVPCAFDGYGDCAADACDWTRTARVEAELEAHIAGKKSILSPFTVLAFGATPAMQLACARTYIGHKFGTPPAPMHGGARRRHDKPRIAYLSAGFNRHTTSHLMANLFERHDRSKFEITGISFGAADATDIRARVVASFDRFHDVRDLSDRDAAKLVNELQIDIAVDLTGHTRNARPGILWHRPAPIQVNYLGYPGTLGADFIDYIIADATVLPPGEERFYAEKVVRLPDCYQVNDSRRPIGEHAPTRRQAGLPEQGFVFCCFNDGYMINAAVFEVWMRLLKKVDAGVLWLLRHDESTENNLRGAAAASGIDPDRLVFADPAEQPDHLARHRLADLFLDTLPCNGPAACSDALWAGLPVLTCHGDSFAGRGAASLLQSIGLPELVTTNLADYAALALWLAQDPGLLGEVRKRLVENRLSRPLFDTDLSRRHIETAYLAMWRLWRRGERPKSFAVEPDSDHESAGEIAAMAG